MVKLQRQNLPMYGTDIWLIIYSKCRYIYTGPMDAMV